MRKNKTYDRVMPRVYSSSRQSLRSSSSVIRHEIPSARVGAKPSTSNVSPSVFSDLPMVLNDYVPDSVEMKPKVRSVVSKPRKTVRSMDPALSPPRLPLNPRRVQEKVNNIRVPNSAPTVNKSPLREWSNVLPRRQCHSSRSHSRLEKLKSEIKAYDETNKMMKLQSKLHKQCGIVFDDFGQPCQDKAVQVETNDKESSIKRMEQHSERALSTPSGSAANARQSRSRTRRLSSDRARRSRSRILCNFKKLANHRSGSRANHRSGSRANHSSGSRAIHRSGSRANHRSGSRANQRSGSRANHSSGSRVIHRASSRAIHRSGSWANHRSGSRANRRSSSRMNRRSGSRANHRSGSPANRRWGSRVNHRSGSRANHRASSRAIHRSGSRVNRRTGSWVNRRSSSRENRRLCSRVNHRSGSRANRRSGSRANHRSGSRANHRASHRSGSRANHRSGSRANHRASSRVILRSGSQVNRRSGSRANHRSGSWANRHSGSRVNHHVLSDRYIQHLIHCDNSRVRSRSPVQSNQRQLRGEKSLNDSSCVAPAEVVSQSGVVPHVDSSLTELVKILKTMSGNGLDKLGSMNNTIPEFDPCKREQTMTMWLHKVDECASIYGWTEKQIIHFALPKLKGIAQRWYEGLPSVLFAWGEWREKLLSAFPSAENYGQMLADMLAKRARFTDSLEEYYYEKLLLINRCGINGKRAVECILHGIDDRSVRLGAEAAQFEDPNKLLSYLRNARNERGNVDRKPARNMPIKPQSNPYLVSKTIRCSNCKKDGHSTSQCTLPIKKCTRCNRIGHEVEKCYARVQIEGKTVMFVEGEESTKQFTSGMSNIPDASYIERDPKQKYYKTVTINGHPIEAFIDFGSECSIIQVSYFNRICSEYVVDDLPILRGFGNSVVTCIGKQRVLLVVDNVEANLDLLIVPDNVMHVPVLIGQTFTEQPHVVIRKSEDCLEITQLRPIGDSFDYRVGLYCADTVTVANTVAVEVQSDSTYNGEVYVEGGLRMFKGTHYSLSSGLYNLDVGGRGYIEVHNTSSNQLVLPKGFLLARGRIARKEIETPVMQIATSQYNNNDRSINETVVNFGESLSTTERLKLLELLNKYRNCFAFDLGELGSAKTGQMSIDLQDDEPVVYRPYRLSFSEKEKVREMITDLLQNNIIRPSTSAFASPIVVVRKKTGELRLCIDYRALNKKTVKENYPMPLINDQLDVLSGNRYYTTLDLASGYYQIPIRESDKHKTAFVTPDGHYEFNRMPFGLANAPATFQRIMNQVLGSLRHKEALAYLDDVIIPSKDIESGVIRLETVLALFSEAGLTLKLSKCTFFGTSVDYLGFEVSSEGIRPGMRKVEAVKNFPVPQNQHNVRQFLGLASFFRRFIPQFATIAKPLTRLLKKDTKWLWSTDQENSFRHLQMLLSQRPVLALYNHQAPTELHTDACKLGLGGILLQKDEQGILRPIAYFSRQTTPEEQNYSSYDLETLAVVASLHKFRVYLIGLSFKIVTDCNSLRATFAKRDMIPRVARWWEQMQEFNFTIEYRAGQQMSHVDALSRNPVQDSHEILSISDSNWLSTVQAADDEIKKMVNILNDPDLDNVIDIKTNFKYKNNKLFRITADGDRWVVPKGVRWQVVKQNHDDIGHFSLDKTLEKIRATYWFAKMRSFVKKYVNSCLECAYSKSSGGKRPGSLHPIEKVDTPFDTIHADHVGPFVRSSRGNMYILAIIDAFTRYIYLKPVRNTKTHTTINVFKEYFGVFGVPRRIITDRGTSFTCDAFKRFTFDRNIKHVLNAVSTPRANGQVERYNRTVVESLTAKCVGSSENKWDDHLSDVQWGLNNTFNKGINRTPSEALFGKRLVGTSDSRIRSDLIEDVPCTSNESLSDIRHDINNHVQSYQETQKIYYDKKRSQVPEYKEGDLIRVERQVPATGTSKKLIPKFQGPYRIAKILDLDRFVIEDTPLTRKGNRPYSTIVAADKIKPWLNFSRPHDISSGDESE